MNVPHQHPHQPDAAEGGDQLGRALEDLARDLKVELRKDHPEQQRAASIASAGRPSTPAARPTIPPVVSGAAPRSAKWGPNPPHADRPLSLSPLENVALSAYALHSELEVLLRLMTGEERQQPIGPRPPSGGPLLPAMGRLASEIEAVLNESRRLVEHMQGRLA